MLSRDVMNEQAVLACRRPGEGLFIEALDRALKRRRLMLPAFEHDLAAELRGQRQAVLVEGPSRELGPIGARKLPSCRVGGDDTCVS